MNKLESLLDKVTDLTREGDLAWTTSQASEIRGVVLNSRDIYLVYETEYKQAGLYLVLQKLPDFSEEFNMRYERGEMFLVVKSRDNNVSLISDNDVAEKYLQALYSAINDKLNRAIADELLSDF